MGEPEADGNNRFIAKNMGDKQANSCRWDIFFIDIYSQSNYKLIMHFCCIDIQNWIWISDNKLHSLIVYFNYIQMIIPIMQRSA